MDIVISLILLLLGLGVITLFVGLVSKSFSFKFSPSAFLKAHHQKALKQQLEVIDSHLVSDRLKEALTELKQSFLVGFSRCSQFSAYAVLTHNLSCLERVVRISRKQSLSAENLGELERLFDEQTKMMTAHQEVDLKYKQLKRKTRWKIRKNTHWAHDEFSKKLEEFRIKLKANSQKINDNLNNLFGILQSSLSDKEMTFH
jgi:hypothetical protein